MAPRYITFFKLHFPIKRKNITRVQNCPDITMLNSLFGLCLLTFFFLFRFCLFCLDIMLIKCLKGLKARKSLFVAFTQSLTHSLTKVRYRAARAAKNIWQRSFTPLTLYLQNYCCRKILKLLLPEASNWLQCISHSKDYICQIRIRFSKLIYQIDITFSKIQFSGPKFHSFKFIDRIDIIFSKMFLWKKSNYICQNWATGWAPAGTSPHILIISHYSGELQYLTGILTSTF